MVTNNPWCSWVCNCITLISTSNVTLPASFCVSLSMSPNPSYPYKSTSHWVKAQPNPEWPHLNLIMSVTILLPNKVTFTRSRWTWILEEYYSIQHIRTSPYPYSSHRTALDLESCPHHEESFPQNDSPSLASWWSPSQFSTGASLLQSMSHRTCSQANLTKRTAWLS